MLFDLDGTLIDSFPGIASAYHHVLAEFELGDTEDADLNQFIGPPIQEVLKGHFGLNGSRLEEGIRRFRRHYGTEGLFRFSKYAGIDDTLVALKESGYELHIATSKLGTMAVSIVDYAEWSELFSGIGGAEADSTRYQKTDIIQWTLDLGPWTLDLGPWTKSPREHTWWPWMGTGPQTSPAVRTRFWLALG